VQFDVERAGAEARSAGFRGFEVTWHRDYIDAEVPAADSRFSAEVGW